MSEEWTPDSWNTCLKCQSPVEKAGGDVDFFDGDEAKCIDCGAVYMASIAEDGSAHLYEPDADDEDDCPEAHMSDSLIRRARAACAAFKRAGGVASDDIVLWAAVVRQIEAESEAAP